MQTKTIGMTTKEIIKVIAFPLGVRRHQHNDTHMRGESEGTAHEVDAVERPFNFSFPCLLCKNKGKEGTDQNLRNLI